jgi:zinc transporter ZupT
MKPLIVKVLALCGILVLTLLSCLIPSRINAYLGKSNRGIQMRTWFYYLMLFSCTLIASTGINHVLPNAIDAFDAYKSGWGYPYPGLICTFVMFLSWMLDVFMDRRKNTIPVTSQYEILDNEDDLPPADPYLFTGAIYIHSVLEGLVLGGAPIDSGTPSKYLYVIMSVLSVHKCFEGFSLAVLYEAYEYEKWSQITLLVTYALLTPTGILIGLLFMFAFKGVESLVAGICTAISAGVFIYAGLSILVTRIVPIYARTNWRFLFVLLGWAVSAAISWFA